MEINPRAISQLFFEQVKIMSLKKTGDTNE